MRILAALGYRPPASLAVASNLIHLDQIAFGRLISSGNCVLPPRLRLESFPLNRTPLWQCTHSLRAKECASLIKSLCRRVPVFAKICERCVFMVLGSMPNELATSCVVKPAAIFEKTLASVRVRSNSTASASIGEASGAAPGVTKMAATARWAGPGRNTPRVRGRTYRTFGLPSARGAGILWHCRSISASFPAAWATAAASAFATLGDRAIRRPPPERTGSPRENISRPAVLA